VGLEDVNVNGYRGVGGLVGYNYDGTITNCYSSGCVRGDCVGGFVGYNYDGTITNCYSTSCVNGYRGVGGFVGYNREGTINNSYSTGCVNGSSEVGGFVGYNREGTINNSYSIGCVNGSSEVGGFVGEDDGTITNSYYPEDDITCTGCTNLIGNTTKANLQNKTWLTTPPNNWDFDTAWVVEEGVTYPYLQWQVIISGGIDLVITDVWYDDNRVYYTITNQGTEYAGASDSALYKKSYYGGFKAFRCVAIGHVTALAPGETSTKSFAYRYYSPPTDTVSVCADCKKRITESNESNNCKGNVVEYEPTEKPDLVITDIWYEGNKTYYKITNQGVALAGESDTALYKVYYRLGVEGLVRVATDPVKALAPGETSTESFSYTRAYIPRSNTVRVCADWYGSVMEGSDANNCKEETL